MKKILLFAALLLTGSMTFAQSLTSGIDPQNLDTSVRPGDDFYHYAAGGWLKNNPLDDEHTDNGAFTDLYEKSQKDIQDLILQYANSPQQKGTLGQKIGSLYNLMMDSVRLNREGWQPIKPTLERIAAIRDRRMQEVQEGDKRIQLVSISLDKNVNAWKTMVKKENLAWPQYIVKGEFDCMLCKEYGVTGIPRFMMFDKKGNIISLDAPRPSAPNIIEWIESNLK